MGIISEFRGLQKDVAVLKSRSGDDVAATGSGFQVQGTAGFLTSSTAGSARLGCTTYSTNPSIQKAFFAASVRLTASTTGAVDVAVKRGKNKLALPSASLVEPTNTYQGTQYLSSTMAWLTNSTSAAYAAIARSTSYAIVVSLVSSGGGGGGGGGVPASWNEATIDVVSGVEFAEAQSGILTLNVTTTTLHYVNSGAN